MVMKPYITSGTVGINPIATPTAANIFHLGDMVTGTDGTVWKYVKASGAIAQYDCVGIDEDGLAAKITKTLADAGYEIGYAQVAFTDTYYGWVALRGSGTGTNNPLKVNIRADSTSDIAVYTTATAGWLGTISTTQTKIGGIALTTSSTVSTSVPFIAQYHSQA